ncbi:MAG TPA: MaoC family dehydratase N-terminal domain-containing protein [Propionibacteriaceae bacterium]|nr:MaoC family dehydratase N-terminal domain-containing protein [Propionibacteriaceae bacterium]
MPISESHVGRTYEPTPPYEVSTAKITEFARAIGDDNPAYFGESPVAPPTFLAIVAARAWDRMFDDEELGMALKRVVHGEQAFTHQRPLRPGDVIQATLTIDKVRVRGAMEFVTVTVTIATTAGEPVCHTTSTLVHSREAA